MAIKDFESLLGKTVAIPSGFFYQELIERNYPDIKLLLLKNQAECLKAVAFGKADATIGGITVQSYLIRQNLLNNLKVVGGLPGEIFSNRLRIGVRDDWPELATILQKAIDSVSEQEYSILSNEWISAGKEADPGSLTEKEQSWLAEHSKMRLGVASTWAPFEFFDTNGVFSGVSSDYVRILTKWLGVTLTPQGGLTWAEVLEKAGNKEIDVISAIVQTPERSEYLHFTKPYINLPMMVVTREDSPYIQGIKDLKDKTIAVVREYVTQGYLEADHPDQKLLLLDSLEEVLTAVSEGRADALVENMAVVGLVSKKLGITNLRAAAATPYSFELSYGVRKDWPEFMPILEKALAAFSDQEKGLILDKWVNVQVEKRTDWKVVWLIIVLGTFVAGSILSVILIWNRRLAGEIAERKLVEEELKKLTRAVEDNPMAVIITDREGTIEYVNPKFTNMNGYESDEAIGQNPRILHSGQHSQEFFKELWETILAGKEWHGEFLNKRKTGEFRWHSAIIAPIFGENEEITHFVSIQEDVTDKKDAAEELQKLSRAIEHSPVSVVITNREGTIEYVNPSFCEVTGYSHDEAIGQNPKILNSGEQQPEFYQDMWKTLSSGRTWIGEFANKKKNGEIYWENASISPVLDSQGKTTHYVAVKEDITQNKLMKEALIKAKEKAEEATKAKGDFLANMSHEIRTPMNAIIGMSHLALKTDLTPKQQDYIGKVQSSSNALLGIINDILDFSKIEAGKLDMESVPFHLEDVLDNLATLVNVKAEEKGLKLSFEVNDEVPTGLVGDSLRLGQILINLGNNAVKFTEKGGIVLGISPVAVTDEKAELQFSVRDSGIGLTEEQRGKLFQAFSQADTSTTRKYGGTGLGLTISKKLSEMMDGKIWVESEPGVGSTFIFTAVFGRHSEKREEVSASRGDVQGLQNIRGARILLAEDNEINQQVAREILEQAALVVEIANNGLEAVEMAQKNPYDVILMDIQMPEMNGFEATKAIRELKDPETGDQHPASSFPIIAMTAHAMAGDREKSIEGGMNDHVVKPIDSDELFSALVKWIEPGERDFVPKTVEETQKAEPATPSARAALPEKIEGIDLKDGFMRVGGNEKLYRSLLVKLRDDYAGTDQEIKSLLQSEKTGEAERLAHSIKGVAGNVGAGQLQEAAADLEHAIKEGEADSYEAKISAFGKILKDVVTVLGVLGGEEKETADSDKAGPEATPYELAAALEELLPHLKTRKPKPCKAAMKKIKELKWPAEFSTDISDLDRLIKKYKFKDALPLAETLKTKLNG